MIIGGKRYKDTGYTLLKSTANREAANYRKKGYKARIVKDSKVSGSPRYHILIRKG